MRTNFELKLVNGIKNVTAHNQNVFPISSVSGILPMAYATLLPSRFPHRCWCMNIYFCTPERCSGIQERVKSATTGEKGRNLKVGTGNPFRRRNGKFTMGNKASPFVCFVRGVLFSQRPSSADKNKWLTKRNVFFQGCEHNSNVLQEVWDDHPKYILLVGVWSCLHFTRHELDPYISRSVGSCSPPKKECEVQPFFSYFERSWFLGVAHNRLVFHKQSAQFHVANSVLLGLSKSSPGRFKTRPES